MEITYTKVGDYLIPDLTLPPEKEHRPIGIWGKRHKRYLMEHKRVIFTIMQMNGTLQTYLAALNEQAEDMTEGCNEKVDAEFTKWILFDGRNAQKRRNYQEIRKRYAEKTVVLKKQRDTDRYLAECTEIVNREV